MNECDSGDRVVVVTGAGQGIGRTIAQHFALAGFIVVATDVDESAAAETVSLLQGRTGLALRHDVTDVVGTASVLDAVIRTLGRVDVLVNNAGVAKQVPFDEVGEADWDVTMDVNAKGTFFTCQAFGRHFRAQGSGRIVNLASFVGKQAIPEYGPYNASKSAVIGITQTFALELAAAGVTVNAICPGIVRTPMWDRLDPDQWSRQVAKVPLGRGQTMDDIAEAAVFLASDRARNITGATLPVTGGLAMW